MSNRQSEIISPFDKMATDVQKIQEHGKYLRNKQEENERERHNNQCVEAANKFIELVNDENSDFHHHLKKNIFKQAENQVGILQDSLSRKNVPPKFIEYFNTLMKCSKPFDAPGVKPLSKYLKITTEGAFYSGVDKIIFSYDPTAKH